MLTITGEVRKILDSSYKTKTGQAMSQSIVVIEPDSGRDNYQVFLTANQLKDGVLPLWEKLKGQRASVVVGLYVNYEHRFHKFTALGTGEPLPVRADKTA